MITDKWTATPVASMVDALVAGIYGTPKPPEYEASFGGGITWNTAADYHVQPVLPPTIHCQCRTPMDAYTSLLSVASTTPVAASAIQLSDETLLIAQTKLIVTLRVYLDPTYSLPTSTSATVPASVTRFYIEFATKFVRNYVAIESVQVAPAVGSFNQSDTPKPFDNCAAAGEFDYLREGAPAGVTHMDRGSFRKFKFGAGDKVFIQAKGCAGTAADGQGKCGTCTAAAHGTLRKLQANVSPKRDVDLSPGSGEMYVPPVELRVSPFDPNALTVNPPAATGQLRDQPAVHQPPAKLTNKAIEISSELSLPLSLSWAVENKSALEASLRKTLNLSLNEDLVITKISAARRLREQKKRQLQAPAGKNGVKVEFTIGTNSADRASMASSAVQSLSQGNLAALKTFTQQLDVSLQQQGKAPVALQPADISFRPPARQGATFAAPAPAADSVASQFAPTNTAQQQTASGPKSSSSALLVIVGIAILGAILMVVFFRKNVGTGRTCG